MSKTHEFTNNSSSTPVSVVLDKIVSYERDDFSESTKIKLVGGDVIHVSETVSQVKAAIDNA